MCLLCDDKSRIHQPSQTRRGFLKAAGAATLGLSALRPAFAASPKAPPKPENVLSPEAALHRLMQGNARYIDGVTRRHDFRHEREILSSGQNPFAGVLSCADSRIAPEYAFDTARGDLFVCRVAGNLINDDVVASFEYAVAVLNTPMILVLGHQACGAVDAAIKSIKDGSTLPGRLPSLVNALTPAVKAAMAQGGDTLNNAIRQNVSMTVAALKNATPILSDAVEKKKIIVVGGVYDLTDGRVKMLSQLS